MGNGTLLKLLVVASLLGGTAVPSAQAQHAGQAQPQAAGAVVTVGDTPIVDADYELALRLALRQKFYHGKVPEGELLALQRTVADEMADRVLLMREAKRRGISADAEMIKQRIAGYDQQYKGNPNYEKNRDQMLKGIVGRLEEQDILGKLEAAVRDVAAPAESDVRDYYEANQALFTEPEKIRVSAILLRVDPSSASSVWEKTHDEAVSMHERLRKGADFAELARKHSSDASAERGGDMGYLHRGMLAPKVEELLDKAQIGEVLEPVRVLEGEAIFRLDARTQPKLQQFQDVRERATELLRRERGKTAWDKLKADLRRATPVKIDDTRFAEIAARLKLDR